MEKPSMDLTRDQKIARQSSEMRALREKQIMEATGEAEPEMITANRNADYQIKAIEAGFVHVFTRVKNLSQDQKSFVNDDRIIAIHAREFDRRVKDGAFTTYDEVEVIHDPRQGAPKQYALKPEQLDVNGPAKSSAAPVKSQEKELARKTEQVEREAERIAKVRDLQNAREKELADKEAAIAAREKALEEAAKKPAPTVTAAPSATVEVKVAEPGTTAAPAKQEAKK